MPDQAEDLYSLVKQADALVDQAHRIEDAAMWGGRLLPAEIGADIKAAHERLQAALATYATRWGKKR